MNLITRYGGGVLHKIWLENWLLSNILKLCGKVRLIGQGHAHGRGHVTPDLTCPKSKRTPSSTYCQQNPTTTGYCSWNDGVSSGGGTYCNANASQCLGCGNQSKWCTCVNQALTGCALAIFK